MCYCKYYIKYVHFYCLLVLGFAGFSNPTYPILNYGPDIYQAGNQNIDFAQNRNRTLFVANNLGVLTFNSNSWDTHSTQTGKKKRSLAFDETRERLYVGSQGEFGFFEDSWQYKSLHDLVPSKHQDYDEVWDVILFDHAVYFCTFQKLFKYHDGKITVLEHDGGFQRAFMINQKLFVQSAGGELLELQGDKFKPSFEVQTDLRIIGLIKDRDGYYVFYNSGKIDFNINGKLQPQANKLSEQLHGKFVNHVLQLSDERIVASTQTAGIFVYDAKSEILENITVESGLRSNTCLRSFQDYAGNIWVGTQNGISHVLINSPIRMLQQQTGILSSGYEILETKEGRYFSTSDGTYYQPAGLSTTTLIPGTSGPSYSFTNVNGQVYLGHHKGLFKLNKGSASLILPFEGIWKVARLETQPDFVVAGTYTGLFLLRVTPTELMPLGKIEGFDESSRFFEEDTKGNIWVSQYYKGVFQLTLDLSQIRIKKIRAITQEEGLPALTQNIISKVDNQLFVATQNGVYELDDTNEKFLKSEDFYYDVGDQPVYLFRQDEKNNVHVVAEDLVGVFRQISRSNYEFLPSSLNALRFHLNNDLLQFSAVESDRIAISSNVGFIFYDHTKEARFNSANPMHLSKVYSEQTDSLLFYQGAFADIVTTPTVKKLDAELNDLTFVVETFDFNSSQQQYRYQLVGFDESFSDWTTASIKEYTNLPPGDFKFKAQTKNFLGQVSSNEPFIFSIKPPWQKTFTTKLLLVLFILLLWFLFYRNQRWRYKKRAQKIKAEVAHKDRQLVEVERNKRQQLQALEEEKLESDLHHVNNLLAASTMNLVIKNEFIETIKQGLTAVKKKGDPQHTKQALEKIISEIDSTLRIQEDWEKFEIHFNKVHGDFLARLRNEFPSLTAQDQKLCAYLRLNLSTKEIAQLMSISTRGVEVARYRLRKRLGLQQGDNLANFILAY